MGQTVKNVVIPAAITVGVGSAAYIGYKTAKSIAGWTHDIVDDIKATLLAHMRKRQALRAI